MKSFWVALAIVCAQPIFSAVPITTYVREGFFNPGMKENVSRIIAKDLSNQTLQVVEAATLKSFSDKETSAKKLLSNLYEKEGVLYFLFLAFEKGESGRIHLKAVLYSCREFRPLYTDNLSYDRDAFYDQLESTLLEIREKLTPIALREVLPPPKRKAEPDEEGAHLFSG